MEFNLPKESYINKFIAKSKFFKQTAVSTKIKNQFIEQIEKITRKYKLAEETIGVKKTKNITEIQIFEIELRTRTIPKNILKIINKTVQYPILFVFIYQEERAYGMLLKDQNYDTYYISDRNQNLSFNFFALTLEKVYQNLIKAFIQNSDTQETDFKKIVDNDQNLKSLEKELESIKNKIKKEKQFNKKVELNLLLNQKKQQLRQMKTQQ